MGYNIETHGQKSFNGVAILSSLPIEDFAAACPATTATSRPAGSRRRSPASASAASTCRTATRPGPEVRLQARLDGRLEDPRRGADRSRGSGRNPRRLQRDSRAARLLGPRRSGRATPSSSPKTRAAFRRLEHLGLTDASAPSTRAPAPASGTTRPAPSRRTGHPHRPRALTRRPPTASRPAASTPRPDAREALRPRARLGHPRGLMPGPWLDLTRPMTRPCRSTPSRATAIRRSPPPAGARSPSGASRSGGWRWAPSRHPYRRARPTSLPAAPPSTRLAPERPRRPLLPRRAARRGAYAGERLPTGRPPGDSRPNAPRRPPRAPCRDWIMAGAATVEGRDPLHLHRALAAAGRFLVEDLDPAAVPRVPRRGEAVALPLGSPASPAPRPASWSAPPAKAVRKIRIRERTARLWKGFALPAPVLPIFRAIRDTSADPGRRGALYLRRGASQPGAAGAGAAPRLRRVARCAPRPNAWSTRSRVARAAAPAPRLGDRRHRLEELTR